MAFEKQVRIMPPNPSIRREVVGLAREFRGAPDDNRYAHNDVDGGVETILGLILQNLDQESLVVHPPYDREEMTADEAEEILAAVHAWASLASRAVGEVYAPASPFPWSAGGWGPQVTKRLQALAAKLGPVAMTAAKRIGANGVSIGISFPWGVSVSITY